MGIFRRHDEHRDAPPTPRPPRAYDVVDGDGRAMRYVSADFDEIFTTTDKREAGRLVGLGWLVLDESATPGGGPGHLEFEMRATGTSWQSTPVMRPGDDVTSYTLGYLRDGVIGTQLP